MGISCLIFQELLLKKSTKVIRETNAELAKKLDTVIKQKEHIEIINYGGKWNSENFYDELITKEELKDSSTFHAQGGIACVWDNNDTFEKHIQDTLIAGDGLCDEEMVRKIITQAPDRINDLIELGAKFTKKEDALKHVKNAGLCKCKGFEMGNVQLECNYIWLMDGKY